MDFYHSPGTCSQATHILLREAGLDVRPHKVDIFGGKLEDGSDYTQVNPNGYVPALVLDDGMLLTESAAILDWIAAQAGLLPGGEMGRTRHLQMLAFISTELHKPFIPLFFTDDNEMQAELRGRLSHRFGWIEPRLEGDYLFGDRFTGADAFLYVMLRWAAVVGLETSDRFARFIDRVEGRESVQATLKAEGLDPLRPRQ